MVNGGIFHGPTSRVRNAGEVSTARKKSVNDPEAAKRLATFCSAHDVSSKAERPSVKAYMFLTAQLATRGPLLSLATRSGRPDAGPSRSGPRPATTAELSMGAPGASAAL